MAIADGSPRTVTFRNDTNSQVIRRDEGSSSHQLWYRLAGRQIGYDGNVNSTDTDYDNATVGVTADFDQSIAHITSVFQGSQSGTYTAVDGETLSSVAANLWGDASLWYKLADANDYASDVTLIAGQIIAAPLLSLKPGNSAKCGPAL